MIFLGTGEISCPRRYIHNGFTDTQRKHCANRTHRVRSSIKTTHGKGREFKKLPVLATEKLKEGQ
jgi:signal recognition particle subunit SRP68